MTDHILGDRREEQAQHRRDDTPRDQADEAQSTRVPKGILDNGAGVVGQRQNVLDAVERTAKEVSDLGFLFGCESGRFDDSGDVGFDFGVEDGRELSETDRSTGSSEEEVHGHDSCDPVEWLGEPCLQGERSKGQADADTSEKQEAVELSLLVVVDGSGQEADSDGDEERTEDGWVLGLLEEFNHSKGDDDTNTKTRREVEQLNTALGGTQTLDDGEIDSQKVEGREQNHSAGHGRKAGSTDIVALEDVEGNSRFGQPEPFRALVHESRETTRCSIGFILSSFDVLGNEVFPSDEEENEDASDNEGNDDDGSLESFLLD